jgi:hypothetical protein
MTARSFDPECRRFVLILAVALVLLLAMVMTAGCTIPAETPAAATPSPTPTIPLTDKELAEKTIADARAQVEKTDAVIGWFRSNASTRDDPQLAAIITKREVALSYIVTAEDEITKGNYERARDKAQDGYAKANESYTDALKRQYEIEPHCQGNFLVHCL